MVVPVCFVHEVAIGVELVLLGVLGAELPLSHAGDRVVVVWNTCSRAREQTSELPLTRSRSGSRAHPHRWCTGASELAGLRSSTLVCYAISTSLRTGTVAQSLSQSSAGQRGLSVLIFFSVHALFHGCAQHQGLAALARQARLLNTDQFVNAAQAATCTYSLVAPRGDADFNA